MNRSLSENIRLLDTLLGRLQTIGVKLTQFTALERPACYYYVDGLVDTQRLTWMQYAFQDAKGGSFSSLQDLARERLCISDFRCEDDPQLVAEAVWKGFGVLLIDGYDQALILEVKRPPLRSIQEPDKAKTLRGPHEGFCENAITNLALIRRRIRSELLKIHAYTIGSITKTDVFLLYMDQKADTKCVALLDKKLKSLKIKSLNMTQEALAEYLFEKKRLNLNPYPKVRFTERPDTAAAMLAEGKVLILCDTSPSVLVLPMCLFDFFEETDDYYFPVLTASYLRLIRILVFLSTVFLAPLWLLATQNADRLPQLFHFVGKIDQSYTLPLYLQLLIVEFAIDGLKLASLNTPSTLSSSLSIVGGLLLGDFAVKSGWFVPQTVLYSAFTAMANFVPSNLELGYCFKFQRMILILATHFWGLWGFVLTTLLLLLLLISTKTIDNKSYLYPLIPFHANALKKLFVRTSKGREEK